MKLKDMNPTIRNFLLEIRDWEYKVLLERFQDLQNAKGTEEYREMKKDPIYQVVKNFRDEGYIKRYVDAEVVARYQAFEEKVESKVGKIKEVKALLVRFGQLNGKVVGEKGECAVRTVVAGGYNIQRAHFRVLVK